MLSGPSDLSACPSIPSRAYGVAGLTSMSVSLHLLKGGSPSRVCQTGQRYPDTEAMLWVPASQKGQRRPQLQTPQQKIQRNRCACPSRRDQSHLQTFCMHALPPINPFKVPPKTKTNMLGGRMLCHPGIFSTSALISAAAFPGAATDNCAAMAGGGERRAAHSADRGAMAVASGRLRALEFSIGLCSDRGQHARGAAAGAAAGRPV